MNNSKFLTGFILILLSLVVSSCNPITGIFDMGMGFGIILVLAVLVLLFGIVMKLKKK